MPVVRRLTERFVRGSNEVAAADWAWRLPRPSSMGSRRMTLASPATGRDDGFEVNVQFLRLPA